MSTHAAHAAQESSSWLLPLAVVLVLVGAYLGAALLHRERRDRGWSPWRAAAWTAGALGIVLALSPPLADAHTAQAHMVQHLLLGMFAPIGLVLGAPVTLLLTVLRPSAARRVTAVLRTRAFHVLSHPVTTASLNVGGMFALYLTALFALSTQSPAAHHAVHAHFLVAGYLFAWSIAGPDPAPRRPSMTVRVVVLVLAGAAHAFLAKLLYARAAELPPGADLAVSDLEQAAQWMYYGGDVAEILLAVALFATWLGRRRSAPPKRNATRTARVARATVGTPRP